MERLCAPCWASVRRVLSTDVDQPRELGSHPEGATPTPTVLPQRNRSSTGLLHFAYEDRLPRASAPEQPLRGLVHSAYVPLHRGAGATSSRPQRPLNPIP